MKLSLFRFPASSRMFWAALCGVLFPLFCHAQDITTAVSPNIVTVGEPATYTITFHNSSAPQRLPPPALDGLQVRGPSYSSSMQTINGRMTSSSSLSYTLFPVRPGSYAIAPPPFEFNGKTISLDPAVLEVRPAASVASDDPNAPPPLRLRAVLDPPSPYIHQTAVLTLEILSLPTITLDDSFSLAEGTLPATGCIHSDFAAIDPDRIELDGTVYDRRRFHAAVRFTSAGTFTLLPGLRANVLTRTDRSSAQARRPRDPFEDMFPSGWPFGGGPSHKATPVDLSTPAPLAVTVRSVPTANRPPDYTGAVGRFTFQASAAPSEVSVGEPVTVSVTLSGDGNIADARPLFYADTPAYKAYDAKLSGDAPAPTSPGGIKRFDQIVMPRTDALLELPVLSFTYFDPVAEAFQTATAGPFPLRVKPASGAASSAALLLAPSGVLASATSGGSGPAAPAALVLATDIHYLQDVPPSPPLPQRLDTALRRAPLTFALPLLLGPAALVLLLAFLRRRHDRLTTDTAALRRHAAPRSARRHIRAAETALQQSASPTEIAAHLSAAATTYFAHRLNLPPGAADLALIRKTLQAAPAAADDLPAWRELLDLLEHIRYASLAPSASDLDAAISRMATLLRHAERIPL
ncbi:MAG: BatD family protein [Kiritimatiellae bacterium]|nr:BatD family protein [Kiritimatiellia bacterium]